VAKAEQPASQEKAPRLTNRQWEVLNQVTKGKPVVPEEGKRIDLTLNSLRKRGFIETLATAAPDERAVYRVTAAGLSLVEIQPKMEKRTAERKASRAVNDGATREVAGFVPRVGQRVWNLDWRGRRKKAVYRVDQVGGDDVQLSVWSGHSFKPVAERQSYASLEQLSEAELAAAIKDGMPPG
jgi:hypothetical protein